MLPVNQNKILPKWVEQGTGDGRSMNNNDLPINRKKQSALCPLQPEENTVNI
jgi:hypothetical protein